MIGSKKITVARAAAVALVALAAVTVVYSPPIHVGRHAKAPHLNVDQFTLKNGMEVVLFHDARVPVVTHMLWYKVGAADDYAGRSGLAHYNEHMMFQGTDSTKSGEFLETVGKFGGRANAFTSRDYTAYFVTAAKEKLPVIMQMEADRMVHLAPSEDHFAKEREVIIEERRMTVENEPSALLGEEMQALLYRNHPYRVPVIGWMSEMQGLSRADVLDFHKQFYHPANAVLVVAGDVTRKELEEMTEKYYGSIPAGQPYKRVWAVEPPQRGSRHTELRHVNVREPQWSRVYDAPSVNTTGKEHTIAGFILAQVLGGGTSSRLYQHLVVQQKVATDVSVGYDGFNIGPGELEVNAHPAKGVTLLQLEAAIDKELADAAQIVLTADELSRAKTLLKAQTLFARDGTEGMARTLGMLVMEGLTPAYFAEWPDRVDQVTAEQVQQAARAMIIPTNSVTGYLLPPEHTEKGQQP